MVRDVAGMRRLACRNCCMVFLFVFMCCYLMLLSTRRIDTFNDPSPPYRKTRTNGSMTENLWDFKNTDDLLLYLYDNLLTTKWTRSHDNLVKLRDELAEYESFLKDGSMIVLDQSNAQPLQDITYAIDRSTTKISQDLHNHLPKSSPFPVRERYKSCAVIGNSGILRKSDCGRTIDKHDFIFRCNLATLRDFSDDVGERSNLTTMNPSILPKRYLSLRTEDGMARFTNDLETYNGLIWLPCYAMATWFSICRKAINAYQGDRVKLVCGHPSHQRSVTDFWAERNLEDRLSTGMYLVTTAIQLCDEVHLYGFWPFSARYGRKRTEVPYHYFGDLHSSSSVHDMSSEFNVLLQLHVKGVIRIHLGPCS